MLFQSKNSVSIDDLLSASTIHGLSQIPRSSNSIIKIIWLLVVLIIFALTFVMTYYSFNDWAEEPLSTSVAQIPIEEMVFPAVTVCPIKVGEEQFDIDIELESLVQNCSYNKNNEGVGNVCQRVQEIHNEFGDCLTFNNIDITINSSLPPEKVHFFSQRSKKEELF